MNPRTTVHKLKLYLPQRRTRNLPCKARLADSPQAAATVDGPSCPIRQEMPGSVFHSVWPVLAVLLYVLLTNVVKILSSHQNYAMRVHDLVLDSRQRRQTFMNAVDAKGDRAGG